MLLQELATFQQMKRQGDKLLCIVFANQVFGRVAFGFDNRAAGCREMVGPDYYLLLSKEAYSDKIGFVWTNHPRPMMSSRKP
jgi:hypothetical protein